MWTIRISNRNVVYPLGRSITTSFGLHQEGRAEYPPIVNMAPEPTLLRQELDTHKKIRNLRTVEEKAIGVNMPRCVKIIHFNKYFRD